MLKLTPPSDLPRNSRQNQTSLFSWLANRRLLPTPCLLCGSMLATGDAHLLCPYCTGAMPILDTYRCHCCCLPLATPAPFCGECLDHPPAFALAIIPFIYAHPLDFLILEFKYRHHLASGHCLSELLVQHIQQEITAGSINKPDLLVPVPLHWWRQWQRGFNQAEFLAGHLGKKLGIPVRDICQRRHQPLSQKGLGRRERQRNLRNIFSVKRDLRPIIGGKHIALIDDVVTTGATARSLSELLIRAGARRVDIWALARTPTAETKPLASV